MIKTRQQIINQAIELIKELMTFESHPDEVARMYAAHQLVNMRIGEEMLKIRRTSSEQ